MNGLSGSNAEGAQAVEPVAASACEGKDAHVTSPETRYAKTADGVHIAYQVVGDGPVDMVFVMGWVTNVEAMWDAPGFAGFLERLASFSRLILFDKRGVGLSDRVPEDRLPDLETRMDDVRAVMDSVGSERAVVFGVSEGGPMSMLFAATYPERTIALVLYGTVADFTARTPEYKEDPAAYLAGTEQSWGSLEFSRGSRSRAGARRDTSPTTNWSRGSRRTCGNRPARAPPWPSSS